MIHRKKLPSLLIMMAAFIFFSANTVYILEAGDLGGTIGFRKQVEFDFSTVKDGPYLNLKSAILINYDNGEVLYAHNTDAVRPIASISKLVAAMVICDKDIDLSRTETITRQDAYRSSRSRLRRGFELTLYDLLHAGLMNSDNRAIRALARATSGSVRMFVKEMNHKVKMLGLTETHFDEPTGLDKDNVSTACEVAKILHYAYQYELIAKITSKKKYRVKIQNRKNTYRAMANTNLLMYSRYHVLSGKTGYIRAADYCLTTLARNNKGQRLTLVVLGVPGNRLRFKEARELLDWGTKIMSKANSDA
ncbi:MAG: serine hydrolase [candidate division Zixibacteria bacterium]|nr:serine hydrolase [candidate division Zixibacteria bacterium]